MTVYALLMCDIKQVTSGFDLIFRRLIIIHRLLLLQWLQL